MIRVVLADDHEVVRAGFKMILEQDAEIKVVAEKLEADAHEFDRKSEAQMHQHHRWAQATTALQVAIALAAIALLTKKKWLEYGMYGVAAVGLGVGALAALHI